MATINLGPCGCCGATFTICGCTCSSLQAVLDNFITQNYSGIFGSHGTCYAANLNRPYALTPEVDGGGVLIGGVANTGIENDLANPGILIDETFTATDQLQARAWVYRLGTSLSCVACATDPPGPPILLSPRCNGIQIIRQTYDYLNNQWTGSSATLIFFPFTSPNCYTEDGICGGMSVAYPPSAAAVCLDLAQPNATAVVSAGCTSTGGGGSFSAALAPTHDVDLTAWGIASSSCECHPALNRSSLFREVYLSPSESQSFAAPADLICNFNNYFGWHWTADPVGPNPGLTVGLRKHKVTAEGSFEIAIAIYRYSGDLSAWYQGLPLVLPLVAVPYDDDASCNVSAAPSYVTMTAFPLP